MSPRATTSPARRARSEEHTSELQSQSNLVCRLLREKKKYAYGSLERLLRLRSRVGPARPVAEPGAPLARACHGPQLAAARVPAIAAARDAWRAQAA